MLIEIFIINFRSPDVIDVWVKRLFDWTWWPNSKEPAPSLFCKFLSMMSSWDILWRKHVWLSLSLLVLYTQNDEALAFSYHILKFILIFKFFIKPTTSICLILSSPPSKTLYIHMSVHKISNLVKTALFSLYYQPQMPHRGSPFHLKYKKIS